MILAKFPKRDVFHISKSSELLVHETTFCSFAYMNDEIGLEIIQDIKTIQSADKFPLCKNCRRLYANKYL